MVINSIILEEKIIQFKVTFCQVSERDRCPMINIGTKGTEGIEDFAYSNIFGMYKTKNTQGHGIQVNDPKIEKLLLKMCNKIAQTVYDC